MRNGVLYMQYSIAEIVGINYKKSKSKSHAHLWSGYNWSAKQKHLILKTVGGIIHTIGVPYMQY